MKANPIYIRYISFPKLWCISDGTNPIELILTDDSIDFILHEWNGNSLSL